MTKQSNLTTDQKILVIDGHPVYIYKLEGFLKGLTFNNITLTKTGKEGIREIEMQEHDIVILSGMLPDLSAHQVCKTIRRKCPEARIIVQIGLFTEDEAIRRFKESGADVVLDRKEKDLNPLEEAVTAALN